MWRRVAARAGCIHARERSPAASCVWPDARPPRAVAKEIFTVSERRFRNGVQSVTERCVTDRRVRAPGSCGGDRSAGDWG